MFSTIAATATSLAITFSCVAALAQPSPPTPSHSTSPNPPSLQQSNIALPTTAYVLGAGDQIRLDIFDVPEFSGTNGVYSVLVDGSLNLPWIGKVSVQGLTLDETAQILTEHYAPYINNPLITVTLLTPRPLRIGIVGEVNRPGVYTTNVTGNGAVIQWQTVTQAIQLAGGITQMADIRNIQIRRPQLDGTEALIAVNLWQFLQAGDLSQDMVLRDGDTLIISTASNLDAAEMAEVATANFSPASIRVNVVGEVISPGVVDIPPNSTLNQALLASGGFDNRRARRGSVTLIRLNPNGTVSKRSIDVDFAAGLNEETNPALRNNDVVVVGRSTLATASDVLGSILSPLNGLFGIFRLFGGL
jgi:polysaccharide export outer membrane protein